MLTPERWLELLEEIRAWRAARFAAGVRPDSQDPKAEEVKPEEDDAAMQEEELEPAKATAAYPSSASFDMANTMA